MILQHAQEDARLLKEMALTPTKQCTKYAAWLMLCRSLAVRLDFDMRILPKEVLLPIITELNDAILDAAQIIANLPDLSAAQLSQIQLPGHLGGLFLTNPLVKLEVAHLSSIAASWHPTYMWLLEKGYDATLAANAIDTPSPRTALSACSFVGASEMIVGAFAASSASQSGSYRCQ